MESIGEVMPEDELNTDICTPPRRQTLVEKLVDKPSTELEDLFNRVLERRPELQARFNFKKVVKKSTEHHVDTVTWDDSLAGNTSMYRDDTGGWVEASKLEITKYKVVGVDFRGLPIVHFGKGRPRTRLVSLLQKHPNSTSAESAHTENMANEPQKGNDLADLTESSEPRQSLRLRKKRLLSRSTAKQNGDGITDADEEAPDQPEMELVSAEAEENNVVYTDGDIYEVPSHIGGEVSVVSDETRKMFECLDCKRIFNSTAGYKKHLSSADCSGFSNRCYMCHQRFDNQCELRLHEHSNCYLLVPSNQQSHVTLEEWSTSRFLCSVCGLGHSGETELLKHAKQSHPEVRIFKCRLCEKSYQELAPLRNHFTKTHVERAPTMCPICKRLFASKKSLSGHVRTAHKSTEVFKCPLCGKQLKSKRSLEQHLNGIHQNNRPFSCQVCEKNFPTKSGLVIHSKIHEGIRDFACDICGATFIQKVRLTEHLRAHEGLRDFRCSLCDKSFYTKKDLKVHERTHTNIKPYICKVCGKAFAQSQGLRKHSLTHSTEPLAFKCQFCVKTFKSSSAVYKHCRVTHRDKLTTTCNHCSLWFVSEADLNRHNHYKHIDIYDGRAEEKTFLSSTSEITEDCSYPSHSSQELAVSRYQCICGQTFDNVNSMAAHADSEHSGQELSTSTSINYITYQESQHTQEQGDTCQQAILVDDTCQQPILMDTDSQLENNGPMASDLTPGADIRYSEEIVAATPTQNLPNMVTNELISLPRTTTFRLSTAATGLTEIQPLFDVPNQQ